MIRTCVRDRRSRHRAATGSSRRSSRRWASTIRPGIGGRDALRRGAAEARPLRHLHAQQLLAVVGRLRPVPGVGGGGARFRIRRRSRAGAGIASRSSSAASTRTRRPRPRYNAFIRYLVPKLAGNPMVIWELANEPRGMNSIADVPQVDRRHRAPDQVAGAGAAGDHRQRGADGVAGLRRDGRGQGSRRARRSTSSAFTCGRRTGAG